MTREIDPAEARAALAEMERRQQQVIEGTLIPDWYWRAVALLAVGLGVAVDTGDPRAIVATAGIVGVGIPLFTGWIAFGGLRHVKVHERLLGTRGSGLIVGFVWLVVGGHPWAGVRPRRGERSSRGDALDPRLRDRARHRRSSPRAAASRDHAA